MKSTVRRLTCASLLCAAVLGLAACGDDSSDSGEARATSADGGRTGGSITAAYTSFPDFLDPALAYTTEAWQTLWTVYTPLLAYKHAEGAEGAKVVPGLAEAMPRISADGRTYRLRLRKGLRYSDGRAVKASDFEHTVKRVLNLESGGSSFFEKIDGAEDYVKRGRARGDISGITTDDATGDITIRLGAPDGAFTYILAMNFGGLVPGDTPFENMTKDPPPGVGQFKLDNVRVNRGYELVRNPGFDVEGLPKAKLDKIAVRVVKNRRRQTQDVIRNRLDYQNDPPAPDQIRGVRQQFDGERYKEFVTNSTYYFFLNHRIAPFDDERVRQAVNYAVDKRSLAKLFGGLLEPSCNFLPPNLQGYVKHDPCPYGDPLQAPDVAKARALLRQAGVRPGTKVTVFGNDEPEARPVSEYLADVLDQLGFDARPRIVEGSVYFATIGNQETKAQTGFTNWFQDFPHPVNFMFLVDGRTIQETNNPNFGNVEDPVIDRTLAALEKEPDIEKAAPRYAAIDKRLVDEAHIVPYGNRKLTVFMSDRMNFGDECNLVHPVFNSDFTSFCLK